MLLNRSSVKAQRTRARLLEAALGLFKEKGFGLTTMRDISERASLAVGATYYHFRSKDEIVFAFYESTQEESERRARQSNLQTADFAERVRDILEFKLRQLGEYRPFLANLGTHALDPKSPLSPFSEHSEQVRIRAVRIFEEAMEGSNLKVARELRPHLPFLLWLYQMSVILFWIYDESAHGRNTKKLIAISQTILTKLLLASRIPILRQVNQMLLSLLELFPLSRKLISVKANE